MTVIEDRIRSVLANQAAAMGVPDAEPTEQLARVTTLPARPRRSRLLIVTAAAGLLIATAAAMTQRREDHPAGAADGGSTSRFETPTVLLQAGSVEVTVADRTFVPSVDVTVEGEPGSNEYTTLELTWHEQGVEQRINIYFASDGTDWWANEIRTYDGNVNAEWIEKQGEFFKSPLGSAYVGDLDLPNLKIGGMSLEAFRRPSACDNPGSPLALIANFPRINSTAGPYGATLKIVDTATCQAVDVEPFTFEYQSDNPNVATLAARQEVIPDYAPTLTRVDLELVAPGDTIIHVVAKDTTGAVVGSADMQVTVRPADPTVTGDTGLPVPTVLP